MGIDIKPRGGGKTTWNFVEKVYGLVTGHRPYMLNVRTTVSEAMSDLFAIMHEFKHNKKLQEDYPDICERNAVKWTQELIIINSPVSGNLSIIQAKGWGQKLRGLEEHGHRPTFAWIDDIDDDEALKANPELNRKKLADKFIGQVIPLGQDMGVVVSGTTVHIQAMIYQAWLKHTDPNQKDIWDFAIKQAILDEDGSSTFPELFSTEKCLSIREKMFIEEGTYDKWNTEYMNNPTSSERSIFPTASINYYGVGKEYPHQPKRETFAYVVMAVDTAFKKNSWNDYSAVTIWGLANDNTRHWLGLVRERWEWNDLSKNVVDLYYEWRPNKICVEDKGSGTSLIQELQRKGIPVEEMKLPGDKVTKAAPCTQYFRQGLIWCANTEHMKKGIEELSAFPNGTHDDIADSVAYAHHGLIISPGIYVRLG